MKVHISYFHRVCTELRWSGSETIEYHTLDSVASFPGLHHIALICVHNNRFWEGGGGAENNATEFQFILMQPPK